MKKNNAIPVIMISGHATVQIALESIRLGAYEFIEKGASFSTDKLLNYVNRALETANLKEEKDFIEKSKWGNFLSACTRTQIKQTLNQEITKFKLTATWIVRQFQNEYNPIHTHGGHLSGVGYLKLPKNFGEYHQKTKVNNQNGKLALVHGSKMFMQESTYTVTPKVGDFYFFPNYLMHTVYPFSGTDEERRSVSFNATVDQSLFNE